MADTADLQNSMSGRYEASNTPNNYGSLSHPSSSSSVSDKEEDRDTLTAFSERELARGCEEKQQRQGEEFPKDADLIRSYECELAKLKRQNKAFRATMKDMSRRLHEEVIPRSAKVVKDLTDRIRRERLKIAILKSRLESKDILLSVRSEEVASLEERIERMCDVENQHTDEKEIKEDSRADRVSETSLKSAAEDDDDSWCSISSARHGHDGSVESKSTDTSAELIDDEVNEVDILLQQNKEMAETIWNMMKRADEIADEHQNCATTRKGDGKTTTKECQSCESAVKMELLQSGRYVQLKQTRPTKGNKPWDEIEMLQKMLESLQISRAPQSFTVDAALNEWSLLRKEEVRPATIRKQIKSIKEANCSSERNCSQTEDVYDTTSEVDGYDLCE